MKTTILVIILLINLTCIKLAFTQTLPTSKVAISFCFEEWLPFSYSDHKNNITGIDIILLKTLLSEKMT